MNLLLKYIAPGTALRSGIEGVLKAKTGGLIVVENDAVPSLIEGGFKVHCRFTPQRLVELGKMDGALILSSDMKKILYANALLTPDNSIPSNETGTRHRAAERTAKQAETMVIAISQRRDEITLFHSNLRYIIRATNEIIRRSVEILQILEKHREIFDLAEKELTKLEKENGIKMGKAISLIQRGKIMLKISELLKRNIIELGAEGTILRSRLKEILYGGEKETDHAIRDYSRLGVKKSKKILEVITYDEILEPENIRQALGIPAEPEELIPKGHRILSKLGFAEDSAGLLIGDLKNLNKILDADLNKFKTILGEKGEHCHGKICRFKEGRGW